MKTNILKVLTVAALLPLGACDILDVESPGRIADADLNTVNALSGMVVGMRYDLSQAVDGGSEFLALGAGELWHGGSYDWADVPRGIFLPEDVGGEWSSAQQARWVAEQGIIRMGEILEPDEFGRSGLVAEAHVSAGFANRMLGERFCSTAIDGGPEEPFTVHFTRGLQQFGAAIGIANAAGRSDLANAALAGQATLKAWTGDWSGAAADAAGVPTSFVYVAPIDTEMRNELTYETHSRFEYTVFNTEMEDHPDDARAPWEIAYNNDGSVANGANGTTPHYQQEKYTDNADDIPLVKGTEMRLLQAEAALRGSGAAGISAAYGFMNEVREYHGMDLLTEGATLEEAWEDLHFERGATLWLEGRRLWDLRRWFEESGPAYHPFLEGRDRCLPISEAEREANKNFRG